MCIRDRYPEVSLSEARTKRDEARKLISEGVDPCEQKRAKKVVPDLQLSFEHIARRWHASNKQWAQSHSDKVLKSLETHVFPFIGNRDITTLSTPDLLIPVLSLIHIYAGGVMAVSAKTKNAGKWHNHIIRRFDINPGDRLYDQGGRGHHPFAGTHHQKYYRHRSRR